MRKKVTRAEFDEITSEEMLARFGPLGFRKFQAGAFGRQMEGFAQGIALHPESSMMKFVVPVGVVVPALWEKTDFILGAHVPALELSHRLGEFREDLTGRTRGYHFYTASELRACFDAVYEDFTREALPWLNRLPTLADVASEYFRYRIGPTIGGEKRPADPFGWAIYGWMLELVGKPEEARKWLCQAQAELMNRARIEGASKLSKEERRLEKLLQG